jgi:hypothetical protein
VTSRSQLTPLIRFSEHRSLYLRGMTPHPEMLTDRSTRALANGLKCEPSVELTLAHEPGRSRASSRRTDFSAPSKVDSAQLGVASTARAQTPGQGCVTGRYAQPADRGVVRDDVCLPGSRALASIIELSAPRVQTYDPAREPLSCALLMALMQHVGLGAHIVAPDVRSSVGIRWAQSGLIALMSQPSDTPSERSLIEDEPGTGDFSAAVAKRMAERTQPTTPGIVVFARLLEQPPLDFAPSDVVSPVSADDRRKLDQERRTFEEARRAAKTRGAGELFD